MTTIKSRSRTGVSVVMATYNGEAFLADAVTSVWAQTVLPLELIIVDDCSRDATYDLANRLAKDSPIPMRLIRLPENSRGPARPMNVGVRETRADVVALLDQDD